MYRRHVRRAFRILLIEDDPGRVEVFREWAPDWAYLTWAKSAGAAIGIIRRDRGAVYGGVLLDHDLSDGVMTSADEGLSGSDVALSLLENFSRDVPVLIHSSNITQIPLVARKLEAKGFWVERKPFQSLTQQAFQEWLLEARGIWEDLDSDTAR